MPIKISTLNERLKGKAYFCKISLKRIDDRFIDYIVEKIFSTREKKIIESNSKSEYRSRQLFLSRYLIKLLVLKMSVNERLEEIEVLGKNGEIEVYIKGHKQDISISISHKDDFIYAAISSDSEIGIDIERRILDKKKHDIIFTNKEEENFISIEDVNVKVTLLWTIKECFLKAIKIGFNRGFNVISLGKDNENRSFICCEESIKEYVEHITNIEFYYTVIDEYLVSICLLDRGRSK